MKIIPLRAVPNQRFTFANGQDRWVIEIKVAITSMICNIWLNDEPVVLGSRIVAGVPFIWSPRLATGGNFGILTEGGDEPWWEKFDTSQQLVFWESDMAIASSRFVDLRSRHISPSLAELTTLVNTAMRIEDAGYYPPTWQSLQEAISYALSVVRSHAPEQGQILLATQMLTSAMGDLIEWLSIDFAAGEWDEALYFSRASTATYWGPTRTLLEAAVDESRIQHDPVTGEPLGVLIEPEATNQSGAEYDQAGGFGGLDFHRYTPDPESSLPVFEGAASDSLRYTLNVYSASPGSVYRSVSLLVRGHGFGGVAIRLARNGFHPTGGSNRFVALDFSTGEVVLSNTGTSGGVESNGSGRAIELTDGWWQIIWEGLEYTDTLEDGHVTILPMLGENDGESYIDLAGIQLEFNDTVSSYIPTIDSPVTRAADNMSLDLSDVFNPDEGTFFFEFEAYVGGGGHQYVNFNNTFSVYESVTPNRFEFDWGARSAIIVGSGLPSGYHRFKISLTYTGQQARLVVRLDDEVSVFYTETDFQLDNTLYLFNRPQGDRASDGIFKTVEYWPAPVSEEQLIQMVGGDS